MTQTPDFATFEEFRAYVERTRERSLMETVAKLTPEEQAEVLEGLDPETLLYDWKSWARPSQILPDGDWNTALICAGRGFGKSRCGSEWVRDKAKQNPGARFILLGRTSADVRDVMVQGPSGILSVSPPSERPDYIPSRRTLVWPNGCTALLMTSQEPDVLRGPGVSYSWADEIGTYSHIPDDSGLTAWQNLRIATREGDHPQVITTTTPKRVPAMQELFAEAADPESGTILVQGRTLDNAANLAPSYLSGLWNLYNGTSLFAQELEGLMLEEMEGALWTDDMIHAARCLTALPSLPCRVVAVDPSVAENPKDECGIMIIGSTGQRDMNKRHAYVLEDASVHGSPDMWVKAVIDASKRWNAPVVAEGNQGQALVKMALKSAGLEMPVFLVQATRNKQTRAEPVAIAYQGKRVHHVGFLGDLETQMTTWIPGSTKKSPDRVDSLVWGITALLFSTPKGLHFGGPIRAKSPNAGGGNLAGIRKGAVGHRAA